MSPQAPPLYPDKRFRIGPLRVDSRTRVVAENGEVLPLAPKAVEVLVVLLNNAGHMVSREDLRQTVWNDVAIDDGNISKNIYLLRNALRERLGGAEVIKTFSRRGYQYVGPVETEPEAVRLDEAAASGEVAAGPAELPPAELGQNSEDVAGYVPLRSAEPETRPKRTLSLVTLAACIVASVATGLWMHHRSALPVTYGSFLTSADQVTSWEPVTFLELEDELKVQALSPSGASVAYRDRTGLHLLAVSDGVARPLPTPTGLSVDYISWSADEHTLLVSGSTAGSPGHASSSESWSVPLTGGAPTQLLHDSALATFSPDGRRVAYTKAGMSELWVADVDGQNTHRLTAGPAGDTILCLLWSPSSDRVVVDRDHTAGPQATESAQGALDQLQHQHTWTYQSFNASTGKLLAEQAGQHFESGALLPDGRFLYPVAGTDKQLHVVSYLTDLNTGKLLQQMGSSSQPTVEGAFSGASMTGTKDGRRFSLILQRSATDVYAADLHVSADGLSLGNAARLTYHAGTGYPTAWSPDGKQLLFDEGDPSNSVVALVTPNQPIKTLADIHGRAIKGQFTPDGKWILFLHYVGTPSHVQSIDRLPAVGGAFEPLVKQSGLDDFLCSRSAKGRCVLRVVKANTDYGYYELTAEHGVGQELAHTPVGTNVLGDWSLSPDGTQIVVTNHDPGHPGISILRLDLPSRIGADSSSAGGQIIPVAGFGTILGATWDVLGRGFFVTTHSEDGYALLFVDLRGSATLLKKSSGPIWAIPSRDGTRIAFPFQTPLNTNVWSNFATR